MLKALLDIYSGFVFSPVTLLVNTPKSRTGNLFNSASMEQRFLNVKGETGVSCQFAYC